MHVQRVQTSVANASRVSDAPNVTASRALNALIREPQAPADAVSEGALPLQGVRLAVKDNFLVFNEQAQSASSILQGVKMPVTSDMAQRALTDSGATFVGFTNQDEFGMGSSTAFSAYGPAFNPHGDKLSPGGSSGGSAATVACGDADVALGSDTGGSVRQPAAFCGVIGFKPSRGILPRWGLTSYASSLDSPGLITRTVADVAYTTDALRGASAHDATSMAHRNPSCDAQALLEAAVASCVPVAPSAPEVQWASGGGAGGGCPAGSSKLASSTRLFHDALRARSEGGVALDLAGCRVGVLSEAWVQELTSEAAETWDASLQALAAAGAQLVPVSVPLFKSALPAYYVLAPAEASSNLSRYDGLRFAGAAERQRRAAQPSASASGASAAAAKLSKLQLQAVDSRSAGFGAEVQRRIMVGNYVLSANARSAYFDAAVQVRSALLRAMTRVQTEHQLDVFVTPTSPTPAWRQSDTVDPVAAFLNDVYTVVPSLCGMPACSVPVRGGRSSDAGVPQSVQVFAGHGGDKHVLAVAAELELPTQAER